MFLCLCCGLTLGELLVGASAFEADLFAFDHARVAREEAGFFKRRARVGIHLEYRAGDAEADGSGLSGESAAVCVDEHVDFAFDACNRERLHCHRRPVEAREVVLHFTVVDEELSRPFANADAGYRVLSSACSPEESRFFLCHFIPPLSLVYLLGLLSRVRMRRSGVDLELTVHVASELRLREHSPNDALDEVLGTALEDFLVAERLEAARVSRVAAYLRLDEFFAGKSDLVRVDDDDEVAGVDVRRVCGLVLARKDAGYLYCETAKMLVGGVDEIPLALYFFALGHVGTSAYHGSSSLEDVVVRNYLSLKALPALSVRRGAPAVTQARPSSGTPCRRLWGTASGRGAECAFKSASLSDEYLDDRDDHEGRHEARCYLREAAHALPGAAHVGLRAAAAESSGKSARLSLLHHYGGYQRYADEDVNDS